MLRDKAGNQLFRRVEVRIIYPIDTIPNAKVVQRAGPRQGFGPDGIDDILMQVADRLETLYPWWNFEIVTLAPEGRTAKFVFKFVSYRAPVVAAPPQTDITKEESSTLEPRVTEGITPTTEVGTSPQLPSPLARVQGGYHEDLP